MDDDVPEDADEMEEEADDDDDNRSIADSEFNEDAVEKPSLEDIHHFVWYDMETTQDTPIEDKNGWFVHKPNLIGAHTSCNSCCKAFEQYPECSSCERVIFKGDDCLKEFVQWLLKRDGAIAVAHNSSGFDGILLTRELAHPSRIYSEKGDSAWPENYVLLCTFW